LIVEVDGYDFHKDRAAFERDRRRDQILTAAGYHVIRVTWRQLRDEPMVVIVRLAQALAGPSQALGAPSHALAGVSA
jgi:very-short-patch-repair endonuclease